MENMIIIQDRSVAVNMRNIFTLEVCPSRLKPGTFDIIACSVAQTNYVNLGNYSRKDMAMDVRNDIILWNNQNFDWSWHIEYMMPQDNVDYQSVRDALTLPAAQKMTEGSNIRRKETEKCSKVEEL